MYEEVAFTKPARRAIRSMLAGQETLSSLVGLHLPGGSFIDLARRQRRSLTAGH
jgi:hypothetical protein